MHLRPKTLIIECATRTALVAIICAVVGCSFNQGGLPPDPADGGATTDGPGIDADPIGDSDGDGIANGMDNCPNVSNADQANADGDLLGDVCDNCPSVINNDQADVIDGGDGVGDACDDEDGDGDVDALDNCWDIPNGNQLDTDSDDYGDVCDNCPMDSNDNQLNSDGDNIGDACDVCPAITDQDQNDEDNDTVGDVCDNCPAVRNILQEDVMDGGDGVGDVCDPRPTQGGDSILFFDGFADDSTGIPPGWYESSGSNNEIGTWSVSGGKLRQARTDNPAPTILWRGDLGPAGDGVVGDVVIETLVEAGGINTANLPFIGLIAGYNDDINTDFGYGCAVQASAGGTLLWFLDFQDGNPMVTAAPEFTMDTGSVMELHHYQYGGTNTICQGADSISDLGRTFPNSYAAGEAMGAIGVATSNVGVSFRHITVYELGGPRTCPGVGLCF